MTVPLVNMCVLVCPTGIDIRDGMQVGCIRCGLCIDACSKEMERNLKPTLIDLKTTEQLEGGRTSFSHYFRFRTIFYFVVIIVLISTFTFLLKIRVPFMLMY